MDVKNFRWEFDEVRKEVAELLDGVDAFAAAIIGHKKVFDGLEVFRDHEDGAFGIAKGFPQVLVGVAFIGFGVKILPADEDQVGGSALLDKQVLIPFVVVYMKRKGDVELFTLASEQGLVVGNHFFFIVFQFQKGLNVVPGSGGGQGWVV